MVIADWVVTNKYITDWGAAAGDQAGKTVKCCRSAIVFISHPGTCPQDQLPIVRAPGVHLSIAVCAAFETFGPTR